MNKFKNIVIVIICLVMMGYIFYKVGKRQLTGYLLKHGGHGSKAVVVDDRNYMGNSPVSHAWSYSYIFYVDGQAYTNDSKDSRLQVGDSVDIEYVEYWPWLNRRVAVSR